MRSRAIIGKPIVSGDGGQKLGAVADLLVDGSRAHVVGLVVGNGWFSKEQVLPYDDIQTVGPDVVVTRSGRGMIEAGDWRDRRIEATRASDLKHKRVLTTSGRAVGTLIDVHLDERSGEISGYEIAGRSFAGLISRQSVIPQPHHVTVGRDAVIVSEEAAASLQADARTGRANVR